MSLNEEQLTIGREAIVKMRDLEFSVIIRDVRLNPCAVDYLIEPTAGKGQSWIDGNQVKLVGR